MRARSDKSAKSRSESPANETSQSKSRSDSTISFVDNRPEAVAQKKVQAIADNSQAGKQIPGFSEAVAQRNFHELAESSTAACFSSEPIQKMAADEIDKKHLWKKLRLEGNIRDFESVDMHTFAGAQYKNEALEVKGITLPYESPPFVGFDLNNIQNNDDLAATMYHEVTHAYDPETPARSDDSDSAKAQDITNEVTTWKKEIEYSIRTGGEDLKALIEDGTVIESPEGMLIPDPDTFSPDALREMGYDDYDTETRADRFNIENYTFDNNEVFHPFGTAEEKHQYESEIQKEQLKETHGELDDPMSDDVSDMYS